MVDSGRGAEAFESRCSAFRDIYGREPLSAIPWVAGTAGAELTKLVIDRTIPRSSRIVDVGCGVGRDAIFFALHGMQVAALDISSEALAVARQLASIYGVKVSWVQGDILRIPVRDGNADVVNDCFVFHNLRDEAREPYAQEVFRVLKPGGLFVLRGFSDWMTPGTGPRRLRASEILETFMPGFECDHLSRFRNLPTEKRPDQWHWLALWRRKGR